jgi:hypothetical protein
LASRALEMMGGGWLGMISSFRNGSSKMAAFS